MFVHSKRKCLNGTDVIKFVDDQAGKKIALAVNKSERFLSGIETPSQFKSSRDFVLKEFTQLLRTMGIIKPKDIFARYGGEEFCLLMPATSVQEAAGIAETIRGKVHMHDFMYEGKRIPVTTSLGVSEMKGDLDSALGLIKAADKALYESKTSGRNKVTVAP